MQVRQSELDGSVTVISGNPDIGGSRASTANIAAELLGVHPSRINVLIGDTAIEPLVSFLHDPKASEVESESERVVSFATARLTAVDALKQITLDTLKKLGWEPPSSDDEWVVDSSRADNLRTHQPLGDTGRFGPTGDIPKGKV